VEREWWVRTLSILRSPGAVFASLREEDGDDARAEPLLAVILLAGIAAVLGTDQFAHALDDFELDGLSFAVVVFLAGSLYGLVGYVVLGFLVYAGARAAGTSASYRRLRQLVALAAVPLAASIVVWPVRLAVHGGDVFRTGGSDDGLANTVFEAVELGALLWSAALVVVGLRAFHDWSVPRALAASLPLLALLGLALARAYGVG
jgi:hypothetical protein